MHITAMAAALVMLTSAPAFGLLWMKPDACETPRDFYTNAHDAAFKKPPCCPLIEGRCPGGGPCIGGTCSEGYATFPNVACVPLTAPPDSRPNIIMFLTDDQNYCAYGDAGECYSAKTREPLPAPLTPHLDALAAAGTVFPIAHNTAGVCAPSLAGIITARYQKDFVGDRQHASNYVTYPSALRSLGNKSPKGPWNPAAESRRDTYDKLDDDLNVIGGYCTYFGGKYTPPYANAIAPGKAQGRLTCDAQDGNDPSDALSPDDAPDCGSLAHEIGPGEEIDTTNMSDLFEFVEEMIYPVNPNEDPPMEFAYQRFFAWHFPLKPHKPLPKVQHANGIVLGFQFGAGQCGAGTVFPLGDPLWCPGGCGAGCALWDAFHEKGDGGEHFRYYGNVWWADQNLREITALLERMDDKYFSGESDPLGLTQNTIIIHFSDNGVFLPTSKRAFTENAYRTRLIVYDPKNPTPPGIITDPVHSNDVLPTVLHYATQDTSAAAVACPTSTVSGAPSQCAGQDLVPYLYGTEAGHVRNSMCGHYVTNPTTPKPERYLITSPHRVGRCYREQGAGAQPTGTIAGSGHYADYWVWDHTETYEVECDGIGTPCCPTGEEPCAVPGGVCLGGECRAAPACVRDSDCDAILDTAGFTCVANDPTKIGWCRNSPDQSCSAHSQCPTCPDYNPLDPDHPVPPCERVCLPRVLKYYVGDPGVTPTKMAITDLLLDPNEQLQPGLTSDKRALLGELHLETVAGDMSLRPDPGTPAPYEPMMKRLQCCVHQWWPGPATLPTHCSDSDFSCADHLADSMTCG